MPTLISGTADHTWTATSWQPIVGGASSSQTSFASSTTTTSTAAATANFTITSADVIDAVMLYVKKSVSAGTFTVRLLVGGVSQATCTCNATDLPASPAFVLFKLSGSVTSSGQATWTIDVANDAGNNGNVTVYRSSTANDWTRYLRNVKAAVNVAPGAADITLIAGEVVSAGTVNARTITVDQTALTTSYGSCDIGFKGNLVFPITAATTSKLAFASGSNINIWDTGLLSMGTEVGAMPYGSIAEIQMTNASAGASGIIVNAGGVMKTYGATKTLQAKLVPVSTNTATFKARSSATATITTSGLHGLATNDFIDVRLSPPDPNFDGSFVVASTPTTSTFTYTSPSSGTVNTTATAGNIYKGVKATATSITLDQTPTLWKNGDSIGISTTYATANYETKALSADVSSAVASIAALTSQHSCVNVAGDIRCDICNLTMNVKIHGSSATLTSYISVVAGGTLYSNYTEFYYLGANAATKFGISLANNTTGTTITYCSFHDGTVASSYQVYFVNSSTANTIIDNNVFYNIANALFVVATANTHTITNNLIIAAGNIAINFADKGSTCSGNVITCSNYGFYINELNAVGGTFSNNTVYCSTAGITFAAASETTPTAYWTILSCVFWRNYYSVYPIVASGMQSSNIKFDTCTFWGTQPATTGLVYGPTANCNFSPVIFTNCTFNSGYAHTTTTTYKSTYLLWQSTNSFWNVQFNNCSIGQTTPFTTSLCNFVTQVAQSYISFNNSAISSGVTIITSGANAYMTSDSYVSVAYPGVHGKYLNQGSRTYDASVFDTATASQRLTPRAAGLFIDSSSRLIALAAGSTVNITAKMQRTVAYNGANPVLVIKANPAAGIASDTTIATYSSPNPGNWETATGTTPAITSNAVLEAIVRCDGTAGWINIDTWGTS